MFQVIYMARNPKDLVVSYYQFHRSLRTMSYRGTFQEFCRRFTNDKRESASTPEMVPPPHSWSFSSHSPTYLSLQVGYGSWFEHVQEFWEHRMDSNVLFLKYEDMYKVRTKQCPLQNCNVLQCCGCFLLQGLCNHTQPSCRWGLYLGTRNCCVT